MSAATIQTKRDLAVTAIEDGDFDTALTYLLSVKTLLTTQPDGVFDGISISWAGRKEIDSLISVVREQRMEVDDGVVRRTRINFGTLTADS